MIHRAEVVLADVQEVRSTKLSDIFTVEKRCDIIELQYPYNGRLWVGNLPIAPVQITAKVKLCFTPETNEVCTLQILIYVGMDVNLWAHESHACAARTLECVPRDGAEIKKEEGREGQ